MFLFRYTILNQQRKKKLINKMFYFLVRDINHSSQNYICFYVFNYI